MEIKLIKDSRGKNLLVFNKDNSNEYNEMGNKVDDYEILQVLGKGSFGFVAKVKSRLNHKIYAMKQIDFSSLKDEKVISLCHNETKLLSQLNHPLITKYYKKIQEGQIVYIIMEFMDNGDLSGFLNAHIELEKPIKEEKLYDIFIQSMKSLTFIHSKNLVHRDIKPENLFINADGIVKLGDFGVSASIIDKNEKNDNYKCLENLNNNNNNNNNNKNTNNNNKSKIISDVINQDTVVGTPLFMSPEMLSQSKYSFGTDIYSMGVTFFRLCFWEYPRIPRRNLLGGITLEDKPIEKNKDFYSKELVDIIYKMLEKDKNKRPNSETILNLLQNEFNKKYAKNSSIGSVLCCLYSYEEFTEYLKKPKNQNYINNNSLTKPISFSYLYGIKSINNNVNEDWNNSLSKIRNVLITENNQYSGNKEIEARHILSYLLGKMHTELNQQQNAFKSLDSKNIECNNKNEALNKFLTYSQQNNKSPIFDFFYGIMKTKNVCQGCQKAKRAFTYFSFNYFYFISFDINLVKENNLSIFDLFKIQNDICIEIDVNKLKYCTKCNSAQKHFQRKQFYSFPPFLIICIDRGNNCQNKKKILYDINLDLKGQYEYNYSPRKYKLIGIVKRQDKGEKEHYISLYYDYNFKSWILRDDSSIKKIQSPMEHKQGIEMIFFYKEIKNNNNNFNNNNINNNNFNNKNNNFNKNNFNNNNNKNINNNKNNNNNSNDYNKKKVGDNFLKPNNINNNKNQNNNNNIYQNPILDKSNNVLFDSIYQLSDGEVLKKRENQMRELERQEEEREKKEKEKKMKEEEEENRIKKIKNRYEDESKKAKMILPEEPADNDPNVCHIIFRIPDGEKNIERKFLKTDKISVLYLFVKSIGREIFMEPDASDFDILCIGFPPKNLEDKKNNTLEEEGLFPNSLLQIREK